MKIFFFIADLQAKGSYEFQTAFGSFLETESNPVYMFLTKLGYMSGIIGMELYIFTFEFTFKKTRYIFTIINIILLSLIAILPFSSSKYITYLAVAINVLMVIIIQLTLSRGSSSDLQSVSGLIFLGFFLIMAGQIFDGTTIKDLGIAPLFIGPLFFIVGAIISISPTIIKPELFSRSLFFWFGFIVISAPLFIIFFYVILNLDLGNIYTPIILVGVTIGIAFLIYVQYQSVRKIISKKSRKEEALKSDDLLKIFTRSKAITEEEVSIAKKTRTCLVCKGKLVGPIYLCPDCSTFYCKKCSSILSTLENACWVCDTAFDESQPKTIQDKEKEIDVSVEVGPKKDLKTFKK
jgi:hypothetical protein